MPSRFQSSFIPQKSMQAIPSAIKTQPGKGMSLLFVINVSIFLSVLALAGGLFLYKQNVLRSIVKIKKDIDTARNAYEPSALKELSRLDLRIEAAKTLLSQHLAITPIFNLLELNTLQDVRYKNFDYNVNSKNEVSLKMSGEARSFPAIALQADLFSELDDVNDTVFENLKHEKPGVVEFSFSGIATPRLVSYGNSILSETRDTAKRRSMLREIRYYPTDFKTKGR